MHQRKRQAELIANNRAYYRSNLLQNRLLISRLSTNIMNSILLHMQPGEIKASSGAINPALAWRAARLNDEKVFVRTENQNAGNVSVDILLDASHSQFRRAAKISSQAYIIAEALSKCHVPCRVMSFCSMSGFTVMRLFNDYSSASDNSGIFDYYTEGCNRDGLAIRAAGNLMSQTSYDHKMLIILSDVKPLGVAKIRKDERDVGVSYDGIRALTDTAHEVRRLRAEGISVICIFTGEDVDLPSARMVYGQDFVRIRDFSLFADTVGKLIIEQMKNYAM
jgi:nitric oxide reductase activation protein